MTLSQSEKSEVHNLLQLHRPGWASARYERLWSRGGKEGRHHMVLLLIPRQGLLHAAAGPPPEPAAAALLFIIGDQILPPPPVDKMKCAPCPKLLT